MKLIVGLGNPGREYENTRHNIGFTIIDRFAKENSFSEFKDKFQGLISEKNINGEKVLLLKPQTYMNLSGNSIVQVVNFYKINPKEDLIVIYDDMDLELGRIRVKPKGSSGGHNGIKSIISCVGEEFLRIKCGIGKIQNKAETVNFVLGRFRKEEEELVEEMIKKDFNIIDDILNKVKLDNLMQKYNKK